MRSNSIPNLRRDMFGRKKENNKNNSESDLGVSTDLSPDPAEPIPGLWARLAFSAEGHCWKWVSVKKWATLNMGCLDKLKGPNILETNLGAAPKPIFIWSIPRSPTEGPTFGVSNGNPH